ncbi:uncharacterized protein LOC144347247 [Saccoglossus kowalevskii]
MIELEQSELLKSIDEQLYSNKLKDCDGDIAFMTPARVQFFTGRVKELGTLKTKMASCEQHKMMSICGLGGCGKTSLAIEYSWSFQSMYDGGIYWISAENDDAFENTINQLAIDIGLSGRNFSDLLSECLKWLGTHESKWLLVIDNLDQYELTPKVSKIMQEQWRRKSRGHILVTTRRNVDEMSEISLMEIKEADCIELKSLSTDEGVVFLQQRTGQSVMDEHEEVVHLVDDLGGLPLALEQAAAYICKLKCTYKDYLRQFSTLRLKLLRRKIQPRETFSKERLTVNTTWLMNFEYIRAMSEEEGIGQAAAIMMEMLAFFGPDDIPFEIINAHNPDADEDLKKCLEMPLGTKQIIDVLTKFSLFQRSRHNCYSVHRLVQEVVRDNLDIQTASQRLQSGCILLSHALTKAQSPTSVLYGNHDQNEGESRCRLSLWGKLANHSCTIMDHIDIYVSKDKSTVNQYISHEVAHVLYEVSIYHSLNKRHAKALEAQNKKNGIIVALPDIDEKRQATLMRIKVPLCESDQHKLQHEMRSTNISKMTSNDESHSATGDLLDRLRKKGNSFFGCGKYHDAVHCYSTALSLTSENTILYRNRSLCYLRLEEYEDALNDANESIRINRNHFKSYVWRAYALGALQSSYTGTRRVFIENSGHASAAVAAYHHPPCNLEYKMKWYYPILVFKEIRNEKALFDSLTSKFTQPNTTFLLHPGKYKFVFFCHQDVQIVGIGDKPILDCGGCLDSQNSKSNCHFENVSFEGHSMGIRKGIVCSFHDCLFSNGEAACDNYPRCRGGPGCKNTDSVSCFEKSELRSINQIDQKSLGPNQISGDPGYAGLQVIGGGTAYVENCFFERCGGGGVLVDGNGSTLHITKSRITYCRNMGLEVRNHGRLYAEGNTISNNVTHGVAIGPHAEYADIIDNQIVGNMAEGVWMAEKSNANLQNNTIGQNGACGLSLDTMSTIVIANNKINDNWFWGVFVKGGTAAQVIDNEMISNKCGGVRLGINYSARVYIDGNTIRDHTGPAVHIEPTIQNEKFCEDVFKVFPYPFPAGETCFHNSGLITTNRNAFIRNETDQQHPSVFIESSLKVCCYCRNVQTHMKCMHCKQAHYCSKKCSEQHWSKHKDICKSMKGQHFVTIPIQQKFKKADRTFSPHLKGIGQGTPPIPRSKDTFIVKIQSGEEYSYYNPDTLLSIYDQTVSIDFRFINPGIYHIIMECGVLSQNKLSTKKIFCWANYLKKGKMLRIRTDLLAPYQLW